MVNREIIKTAEQFLTLIPAGMQVKKSYLFGSFAKESQKEESDIDVALVLGNMPDFFDAQRILRKIRRQIDLRIEPHPIAEDQFNPQNPFAVEIQRTGIELRLK
jgi:predicted nucleotidyltransferase